MVNIILLILISILFFLIIIYNKKENYDNTDTNVNANIEIVIARYNEDLNWLKDKPFNKYKSIVYNKGINDNFEKYNVKNIMKLKNIGRCDHTYLYHIINNYDNLADITFFCPGSLNMESKINKGIRILKNVEKYKNTVIISNYYNNLKKILYNFKLDKWEASDTSNKIINNESKLELAKIRPFGKWFENKFGNLVIHYCSYQGIMAISKKHILQNSKKHYINIIKDVENSSNPEAGHYIERSWEAIFYPLTDAIILR
jgi:hypothetical protein